MLPQCAAYVVVLLFFVGFPLIVRFEEKELPAQYGGEYEMYHERAPRFIPRF